MADIRSKVNTLYSMEQLSAEKTTLHRIHPAAKLAVTVVYLVCVASMGSYELGRLAPFLFYPILLMSLADIPYKMIVKRAAVALPFCLFAGIGNLIFDSDIIFAVGQIHVSAGFVSLITLLCRTILCVSDVLILVALTPFSDITNELRRLHIPDFLVTLLEMTYRYLGVLVEEAENMITAYRLRANGRRWPNIKQFGTFIGQLLLRSYNRAERIYQAMQCRLYGKRDVKAAKRKWRWQDIVFLAVGCGSAVLFRAVDVTALLGSIV